MFVLMLLLLVVAAIVHARRTGPAGSARIAECVLVYVLVGYCGLAQLVVGGATLLSDELVRHLARVSDVGEVLPWFASMYVGAALAAVLAVRLRGDYLIGPVLVWSAFFAGATWAHLHTEAVHGRGTGLHATLWIFAAHGLVSAVLLSCLWLSRRGRPSRA